MIRRHAAPLILVTAVAVGGLYLAVSGLARYDEVARVASPGAPVDAVVIRSDGGATTDYGYFVCLAHRDGDCDESDAVAMVYGAYRNSRERGVSLRWAGPRELRIEFQTAKEKTLYAAAAEIAGVPIRVHLDPGVGDWR